MPWRAAKSLLQLHAQLRAAAPAAAPPATDPNEWGLISDAAHDPTSDHTPHDFPGWGKQIVTAADFPNRPDLGLDAHVVLDAIRASRDERVKYGISNGQMFSSYTSALGVPPWTWRQYTGKDLHSTHGHLSVVGNKLADDRRPWTIGRPAAGEEEDMSGASFGPITINVEGYTSLTIPPVRAGLADPRPDWLNFCNDTDGQPYSLRLMVTGGDGRYAPVPGWGGADDPAVRRLTGGERVSLELPAGTSGLSVCRVQNHDPHVYPGHLTVCIERGPIV